MEIPHIHRSCTLSDTIQAAHTGWMKSDLNKSFNLASLAIWRSENFGLWITDYEETFLKIALDNPPEESKV